MLEEKEFIISKQLLRSATSIGANVEEAIGAFSKKEFVYKMTLAYKEARESRYWILLLDKSNLSQLNVSMFKTEIENILSVLTKIIKTTKINLDLNS